MKSIRILSLFWFSVSILVSLSGSTFSQDAYYQDKNGPIPLWYYPDKLVVRFTNPGDLDGGSLLGIDPAFDPNKEPELTLFGFYYVWLIEGSNVASVVARLDTNQAVDIAKSHLSEITRGYYRVGGLRPGYGQILRHSI